MGKAEEETATALSTDDLTKPRLEERVRQQAAVAELGQFALSSADLSEILERAVATVASTLDVEYAKVLELLPDGETLLLKAGVGWQEGLVGNATVGSGTDSQAGYTLRFQGPVIVEDLSSETRFNGPPLLLDHNVVSGMSTIIAGRGGHPYGVLGTHSTERRVFTPDDVHFLQGVANILAMCIERWQVQRDLALYREVFTNSIDGIAIIGLDGCYLEQNHAHEMMVGYSNEELLEQTPAIHMGEETFARVGEALRETGKFRGEVVSTTKDGRQLNVELVAFAVRDDAGRPAYFVGLKRDVTEQRHQRDLLAVSESRYRQLVESAPLAIAVHREQKLIFANSAAAELVGAPSAQDLIGRSVLDFVHPDQREELLRATREARAQGIPTPTMEAKLLALDSRVLDVELVSIPLLDQDEPATQVLVRDITEQKLAERRLRFLVEAGDLLNASLGYEETLQRVAHLAVEAVADWAAVDVLQSDGTVSRVAVAHPDPSKVEQVYEITRRYPPNESSPVRTVMRTGEPMRIPEFSDELVASFARDAEHLRLIMELGLRSAIIVPLQARGHVLGALTFVTAESGRLLTEADFELAKEVAARSALALDNARLYQEAEQQRAAAHESAERLQFILRSARVGTWDWDVVTGRVRWSDSLEEIHGLPRGTFGGTFEDYMRDVHPEDRHMVLGGIEQALAVGNGPEYEVEYRITHPAGVRWLAARGTSVRDEGGRVIRMAGVCTDVTHRKEAEEALRAEQQRLATLVEVSPVGVIIWRPTTDEIVLANPEASRILRRVMRPGDRMADILEGLAFTREDGENLHVDQLPGPRVARSGEQVHAQRLGLVTRDGRTLPLLASAAPFHDEQGATIAVALLLQDITSLMETERLRNEFLGMVTHEMRSPLVVIKSAAAMAKEDMLTTPLESPEMLDVIDDHADRMLSLVTNLLDMAQIEAGAFSVDPHLADLREVLDAAVAHLTKFSATPVKLRIPGHLPPTRMDAFRIGQVMNNLLSNAARFAEAGSAIRVDVTVEPESLVVAVRNNGSIIPPDQMPLLFKKFTRLDAGDGRRAVGTGLGLSICKGIIEAHQGAIWAESIEASRETAFYFRLPLEPEESDRPEQRRPSGDSEQRQDSASQDERFRILAVDDEPVVLKYVQNLLRRAGYDVIGISNAPEAPPAVRESQPDLVLLDLMMPEMSGFEVLEQIRGFSDVPVIFLSASDRDEDKVQGLTMGADDYISKPFSTTELSARIAAVLRRRSTGSSRN